MQMSGSHRGGGGVMLQWNIHELNAFGRKRRGFWVFLRDVNGILLDLAILLFSISFSPFFSLSLYLYLSLYLSVCPSV